MLCLKKLFTNFYYARRNDARRKSRALASLLYFFFPATSVLVALVVMVFFKYPKKLDQDGYKAFFLCTSVFKHLFRLTKEKKTLFNYFLFNDEDAIELLPRTIAFA